MYMYNVSPSRRERKKKKNPTHLVCVCVYCVFHVVSGITAVQHGGARRRGMHNAMREVIAEHREISGLLLIIQGETGRLLSCPMRS
jgi:hypothetical protein